MKAIKYFLSPLFNPLEKKQIPMVVIMLLILSIVVLFSEYITKSLLLAALVLFAVLLIEMLIFCYTNKPLKNYEKA